MSRAPTVLSLALAVALVATACGDHEFSPPSEESRIAGADTLFSPAMFDTIEWSSRAQRIDAGNMVFAQNCRRCHGPVGRGNTQYDRDHDLHPPSLVEPDFPYDSVGELRHVVFTGHRGGMPGWGVASLDPRDIDAASFYLLEQLRPEMLSDSTRLPGPLRERPR